MPKRSASPFDVAVAACASDLKPTGQVRVIPAGVFRARDGRPHRIDGWRMTDADAAVVLADLALRQDDLVIDYEHQTLAAAKNGQPAPAAGWFSGRDVQWRPGEGLFVTPRWTEAAKAAIAAGEYRYFSPVIRFNPSTGHVVGLEMGAVTNNPAIDGLGELQELHDLAAAKFLPTQPQQEDGSMKELLKLLGLEPDATEDQAVTALKALQTANTDKGQQIAALTADLASKDDAIAAAKAETPEDAMTALQSLQGELAALKAGLNKDQVNALVDQGLAEGKLTPAMKDWAIKLGQTDMAQLSAYLDGAQPIAALSGRQTKDKDLDRKDGQLNETELAVCSAMGVDPKDYQATLAQA